LRQAGGHYARQVNGECEQSWYLVGKVAWFTRHVREDIGVAAGQLCWRRPAPGELDDAAAAPIIGVRRDQAGGLALYQGRAGTWSAVPGFTPARRAAVRGYEAVIGGLGAGMLVAAGRLELVTMDALLAGSGLRRGGAV
jgi:hypothetical protein